jgi:hypothetical protein
VLLYRAVTYLPLIPLGVMACLTWRYAPALIHARTNPEIAPGHDDDGNHVNDAGQRDVA